MHPRLDGCRDKPGTMGDLPTYYRELNEACAWTSAQNPQSRIAESHTIIDLDEILS
jgi:hypothetical protein